MRPPGTAKELERRRRRAMALLDQGVNYSETARRIGCSLSSVHRWDEARKHEGDAGLLTKPIPGRPRLLTPEQESAVPALLEEGAMAHGWSTDLWTTPRIADVIERHFGVRYHCDHIGRLLHRLGWSCQKPRRVAKERDEAKIARWVQDDWPRIKKKPRRSGR
jgi:transposase